MNACKLHPKAPSPKCRVCKQNAVPQSTPIAEVTLKAPDKTKKVFELHGNKHNFNLGEILVKNITTSSYFYDISGKDVIEVVREIEKYVNSAEPWLPGSVNIPTSLSCCLFRLFQLKLTEKQLRIMTENANPYVKITAFLYIRLTGNPEEFWHRYHPHIFDLQEFSATRTERTTIGAYLERLLADQNYYSLQLPRIPVPIFRLIEKELQKLPVRKLRFQRNLEKNWEKGQVIYVWSEDSWKEATFKHKDTKAHVQINGVDFHFNLADVTENPSEQVEATRNPMKPSIEKKCGRTSFAMPLNPRKRSRSRSPPRPTPKVTEAKANPEIQQRIDELTEIYKNMSDGVSVSQTKSGKLHPNDSIGPETLNLK